MLLKREYENVDTPNYNNFDSNHPRLVSSSHDSIGLPNKTDKFIYGYEMSIPTSRSKSTAATTTSGSISSHKTKNSYFSQNSYFSERNVKTIPDNSVVIFEEGDYI